jgi:predicted ArsR family transcriptional regulator
MRRVTDQWGWLELLADRMRRALYELALRQGGPVTREEAAEAIGISRGLAAFHLDKLVEAGLLSASYEAPEPRGRGRAPKVYRATGCEIDVSLPGRHYDLMGEILAEAIDADPADAWNAALTAAYRRGRAEGDTVRRSGDKLEPFLDRLGFEPDSAEDGTLRLRNCPFHRLAVRHTELICALNQSFIRGVLHGVHATALQARLAPAPGFCCVQITAP